MVLRSVNVAGFCAGFGMLETGVRTALDYRGVRADPVCYVERDAAAAAALVARMEAKAVGLAPIWDDLANFDGRRWRGVVDIAVAGLPCPAYSLAGKQAGNDDARAWGADGISGPVPQFARIIGEMRPAVVFCENVGAWVVGGHFRRFGEELCRMGYEVQEPVFIASEDVGANHCRERVFVMAHARGDKWRSWSERFRMRAGSEALADSDVNGRQKHIGESGAIGKPDAADRGSEVAIGASGVRGGGGEPSGSGGQPGGCDEAMGDPGGDGRGQNDPGRGSGRGAAAGRTGAGVLGVGDAARLPLYAPGRNDWPAWRRVAELDPSLMPAVESGVPMVVDGLASPWAGADLLRIGGNGVDPLAAAVAFGVLIDRALSGE